MFSEKIFSSQSRRSFLIRSAQTLAGLATISIPELTWAKSSSEKRTLSFFHERAQKEWTVTYAVGGKYDPTVLSQVNMFLRDYQADKVHKIDPKLLDILWAVQRQLGVRGTYEVVSGYRCPQTNQRMRRRSRRVAGHSLHMEGRAIDISLSGARLSQIRQCAMHMQTGGVGIYPRWVHLDTGEYRTW